MASRLDALKKQKLQNETKNESKSNDYTQVLESIMNRPNESRLSDSDKEIVDIEVSLIDNDELNEQMFGYEDLDNLELSFDTIGNKAVIVVYRRANGRYLCESGNQRLLIAKRQGDKTITCYIDGNEPSEEKRIENLIFMNTQRTPKPYYLAAQLVAYEKVLHKRGIANVSAEIEQKFGIKSAMQRRYKSILKLDECLQNLFKRDDVPLTFLLERCSKLKEGKEREFASVFYSLAENEEVTTQLIAKVFSIVNEDTSKKENNIKIQKTNQIFKELVSLPYYDNDVIVPDNKKAVVKQQALDYKAYLDKVIAACD